MQEITLTGRVDSLGRVMIPKYVRAKHGIKSGDLVEFVIRIDDAKSESSNPQMGVEALAST